MKYDLTNQRFGKLTVLSKAGKNKYGHVLWLCKCDCGNEKTASTSDLNHRSAVSCGCIYDRSDITGQRFGKLTAVEKTRDKGGLLAWRCLCECGKETTVRKNALKIGRSKSCGCSPKKNQLKGQRFGKLTVIEEDGRGKSGVVLWKCLCDCGNESTVQSDALTRGLIKSCGCGISAASSLTARRLVEKNVFEGTHLILLSRKHSSNNSSGIKGVYFRKDRQKWYAKIEFKRKQYNLGTYESLEEAAEARRNAEKELFDPILKKYNREVTSEENFLEALENAKQRLRSEKRL